MSVKRKNTWLLFLLILLVSQTTWSNGQKDESDEINLEFWYFHSDAEGEFMESLATKYSEHTPGVTVSTRAIPQSEYLGAALTTAFASGDGPDVFLISPGDFLKYANSGVAMDLSEYFTQEIRDDFLASSIDAVTVNDKIMGIPFEIELLGLYYNKSMLAEAGLQPPETWNELIESTKALTTDERYGFVIEPGQGYFQNFVWYPFLWQSGGKILNPDTMKSKFNGPEVEQALQVMRDLIANGAARSLNVGGWDASHIGEKSTAMMVCGTWIINTLENNYPNVDIGVVPIPVPENGSAATDAGGWKFMVNSKSHNADAAAKFIMWAMAENVELPLEWCTDVKFAYSPRKSVIAAGEEIYSKGMRKTFTEDIYDTAIGEPRYPAEIVTIVGDAIQSAMFTDRPISDIVSEADKEINQFLKDFKGSM